MAQLILKHPIVKLHSFLHSRLIHAQDGRLDQREVLVQSFGFSS